MLKTFDLQTISKHNTEDDGWLIINSKVYNVSNFIDAHPGGKRIILPLLGKDATQEFHQYHTGKTVLAKYTKSLLIGSVEERKAEDDNTNDPTAKNFGSMITFADPSWYQAWKSPYYNDSHRRLRHWARNFIEVNVIPFVYQWEIVGKVPKELYQKFGEAGYLNGILGQYPWPKNVGPPPAGIKPEEFDVFHEQTLIDELARCASAGVGFAISLGPSIALPAILNFANKDLVNLIVKPVLEGKKTICLCITEPYAGSDVASIQTTATLSNCGEHYLINGEKKWITNGTWADYFIVAARTGRQGMTGITLFLLKREMVGLRTRPIACQGNVGSGTAFVIFENVKVPKENIIGELNHGFKYIMFNFNHERLGIIISTIRMARICYEEAMIYSNKRKTFGKFLFEHGVIRNKLAHMVRKIEASQCWLEYILFQIKNLSKSEANVILGGPIALLKAQATTTVEYCAREASQIMGGIAYTKGGVGEKIERIYREVRGAAIPGGSEEIMLDLGMKQALKISKANGAKI